MTNIKIGDLCVDQNQSTGGHDVPDLYFYLVIDIMPARTKIYKDPEGFNMFVDISQYAQYNYDICTVMFIDVKGRTRFDWRDPNDLLRINSD